MTRGTLKQICNARALTAFNPTGDLVLHYSTLYNYYVLLPGALSEESLLTATSSNIASPKYKPPPD